MIQVADRAPVPYRRCSPCPTLSHGGPAIPRRQAGNNAQRQGPATIAGWQAGEVHVCVNKLQSASTTVSLRNVHAPSRCAQLCRMGYWPCTTMRDAYTITFVAHCFSSVNRPCRLQHHSRPLTTNATSCIARSPARTDMLHVCTCINRSSSP